MCYSLYILTSTFKDTYYIGSSGDHKRHLPYHNSESKGYTQRYRPWTPAYTHLFDTKQQAIQAVKVLKNWKSKKMIRLLIEGKLISMTI